MSPMKPESLKGAAADTNRARARLLDEDEVDRITAADAREAEEEEKKKDEEDKA